MPSPLTYKSTSFSRQISPENIRIFHSTSSGKEKDSETGYYYFGARYYNSDLNLWLSVDPMSDKYPNLSPYNYCAWNPMKIVDPDGRETKFDPESEAIVAEFKRNIELAKTNAQTSEQRNELQQAISELAILCGSNQMYHIEYGYTSNYYRKGETGYDIKNNSVWIIIAFDGKDGDIAHELKHAYQFETGDLSFDSRTGGCATAVLYDVTDEEAAYRRGAAFGKEIPRNLKRSENFPCTNTETGKEGLYYPFLQTWEVSPPDYAGGKDFPANSKAIHGKKISENNIYRYDGKTYKN